MADEAGPGREHRVCMRAGAPTLRRRTVFFTDAHSSVVARRVSAPSPAWHRRARVRRVHRTLHDRARVSRRRPMRRGHAQVAARTLGRAGALGRRRVLCVCVSGGGGGGPRARDSAYRRARAGSVVEGLASGRRPTKARGAGQGEEGTLVMRGDREGARRQWVWCRGGHAARPCRVRCGVRRGARHVGATPRLAERLQPCARARLAARSRKRLPAPRLLLAAGWSAGCAPRRT